MTYDNIKWYMDNKGYWFDRKYGSLHRYIYTQHNGTIPEGYIVHYDNENKLDNSPKNLIAMTRGEHQKLHHKGKFKGEKAYNAKLTELDVKWIKVWLSKGYTGASIAKAFKVCCACISDIKSGKRWSHVTIGGDVHV